MLGDGQLAGTSGRSIQRGEGERRKRTTSDPANLAANATDVTEFDRESLTFSLSRHATINPNPLIQLGFITM
jgi:hypothetical protein